MPNALRRPARARPSARPRRGVAAGSALAVVALLALVDCGGPGPPGDAAPANPPVAGPASVPPAGEASPAAAALQRMVKRYQTAATYSDRAAYYQRFRLEGQPDAFAPPPDLAGVAFDRHGRLAVLRSRTLPANNAGKLGSLRMRLVFGKRLKAERSDVATHVLDLPGIGDLTRTKVERALKRLNAWLLPTPLEGLLPQLDLLMTPPGGRPRLLVGATPSLLLDGQIDGAECRRVRLDRPSGRHTLWIDKRDDVLRRIDMPTEAVRNDASIFPGGGVAELSLWIDLRDAQLDVPLAERVFALDPAGRAEVQSFQSDRGAESPAAGAPPPTSRNTHPTGASPAWPP